MPMSSESSDEIGSDWFSASIAFRGEQAEEITFAIGMSVLKIIKSRGISAVFWLDLKTQMFSNCVIPNLPETVWETKKRGEDVSR